MHKIFFPFILFTVVLTQQAAYIWTHDGNNHRPFMIEHPGLDRAAQWKAEYIGSTGDFAHCTKTGECPNFTIRRFGCNHPYKEDNANNVESLVMGTSNIEVAYNALINSEAHRMHLWALHEMFVKQTFYGIGYSNLVFVFISSECR